jgi:hypothetical protein
MLIIMEGLPMRTDNITYLDRITLGYLEDTLDRHTRDQVPVDRWTEFSWSVSRHQMFTRCRRQYYLNYYGARRVRDAANPVVSAVWWLKQITGLKTWIGSLVHEVAQDALNTIRSGREVDDEDLMRQARERYRECVRASARGVKCGDRWVSLHRHAYPNDPVELSTEDGEGRVEELVRSLLGSEAYTHILSIPPQHIREVDEPFQSFVLEGVAELGSVKVFAIPDVLLHDGKSIRIIDWKTGEVEAEGIAEQAGIYRLYAYQRYGLPEARITVEIADLLGGGESVEPPGGTPSVADATRFAYHSIGEMVALIENMSYHTVKIADFPMTDDLSICQKCGFKRACWRHG